MPDDSLTATPGTPKIEIRDLVKVYRRAGGAAITPIDHVDLTVMSNEMVVLLGPSGCGKTTLLRCVAGLERPDEGEIVIDGQVVFSSRRGIYEPPNRRRINMVFQSYALWPHMTVAANVAYPLQSLRVRREEIDRRVSEILAMVGVGGLEAQYPGRISGGQQQRVALARALVAAATVVLFDEPLSNVDALVRAQLRLELKRMQMRLGFSGLYVTHDQTEAMELAHRVAVLRSGRIMALGTPKDVYRHPPSEYVATFIGVANVWSGSISGEDSGILQVSTPLGTIEAPARQTGGCPPRGSSVKVIARPEALRLTIDKPANGNAVEVAVEAALFSGTHTEVVVTRGEQRIRVWVQGDEAIESAPAGRPLWLTIPSDDVSICPAEG